MITIIDTIEPFEFEAGVLNDFMVPFLEVSISVACALLLSGLLIYGAFKALGLLKL